MMSFFRRRGRGKRRHRYAVIDEDEDDKLESMEMLPKGGKRLKEIVTFAAKMAGMLKRQPVQVTLKTSHGNLYR